MTLREFLDRIRIDSNPSYNSNILGYELHVYDYEQEEARPLDSSCIIVDDEKKTITVEAE